MKIKNLLYFLMVILAVSVMACGKDDKEEETPSPNNPNNPNNPVTDTLMTSKVDGASWTGSNRFITNNPATTLTLMGIDTVQGTRITISFTGTFAAGTYGIGQGYAVEYRTDTGVIYSAINGSVIFTKFNTTDRVVSGTFSCTVKENNANTTKEITNGKFENLKY